MLFIYYFISSLFAYAYPLQSGRGPLSGLPVHCIQSAVSSVPVQLGPSQSTGSAQHHSCPLPYCTITGESCVYRMDS